MGDGDGPVVEDRLQYDTNVDDLDPRLWPRVLERLLDAGADDAWITPIIMKKGRPAHTLSALCRGEVAAAVRRAIFTETSTIGLRETPIKRYALDRSIDRIEVHGHPIDVKTARLDGDIVNRSVEWEHVAEAADALGMSAKDVLALAIARAGRDTTPLD